MFIQIGTILAPLFVDTGIGFAWVRLGYRFDGNMIGRLITTVTSPCLLFYTLTSLGVSGAALAEMGGSFLLALACLAALALGVSWLCGLDPRVYTPTMTFGNTVGMGLPVCLFAFGQEGFALGMGANVANILLGVTAGMAAFAGSFSISFLSRNAYAYSALAASGFLVAGVVPPRWLSNTTLFIGAFSIPFLMFSLGGSIARLTVADLPRAIAISVVRQSAALGIGWGLAGALGLQGAARGVLILQCAMPSMIINYILAQRYERQPEQVAGVVLVTTVISFLTLPIVLLFVLPGAAQ